MSTEDENQAVREYVSSLIASANEALRDGAAWSICPYDSKRDFLAGVEWHKQYLKEKGGDGAPLTPPEIFEISINQKQDGEVLIPAREGKRIVITRTNPLEYIYVDP